MNTKNENKKKKTKTTTKKKMQICNSKLAKYKILLKTKIINQKNMHEIYNIHKKEFLLQQEKNV